MDNFREEIAAHCHAQWSGWMRWMFGKSGVDRQGNCVVPRELYKRWYRQMKTSYTDLSEEEKDSDRKEADEFISLFKNQYLEPHNLYTKVAGY